MDNEYSILEGSIRDTLGGVVWTHKIQEKQADIYTKSYNRMETGKIVVASLTSAGVATLLFTDELWLKIVSTLISFITVFINAFYQSFDLQKLISSHNSCAQKLLVIRDDLKILLLEIRIQKEPVSEIARQYKEINVNLHNVYEEAPRTTEKAVEKARVALNITKDNSFSDEEIDCYLPNTLHRRQVNE